MSQDSNNKDINGKEQPIYRSSLDGRSIEHAEMDYNLSLIGKTIQGYKVMGSGAEGSLDLTDDLNKVLKLHKIIAADTELIANGGKVNEYVWILGTAGNGGGVSNSLIPDTDAAYDLGSPTKRFRDLYLTNNTLYLGEDSVSTFEGKIKVNNIPLIDESDFLAEIDERARLLGVETELRTVAVSSLNNKLIAINDETSAVAQSVLDLNTAFTADLTNAITGERLARTEAISDINETLTSLSTGDGAIAESITALDTKFTTELNDAITGEATKRTEAIGTINQTLTALSNADEASAESITALDTKFTTELNDSITGEATKRTEAIGTINQTLTALSNADEASAESITALDTKFITELNDAVSIEKSARELAILGEVEARTSEIKAVSDSIPTEFNTTGLATKIDLQGEADERARLLGIETRLRTESDSAINETLTTLNTANLGLAQDVTNLGTSFSSELADKVSGEALLRTEAIAGVNESITALTDKDKAIALSVTELGTKFTADIDAAISGESDTRIEAITNVTSQIVAISDANSANVTRVNTLEAQYTIDNGSITGVSPSSAIKTTIDRAVATANQATVSSTTSLIAALGEETAGVTTQQSADINALTGKVNAQYTLEVNADGNVAGMKLGADENGSAIAFTADSFKVSSEDSNGTLLTPFSIVDGQVAFNGAVSFSAGPAGPPGTPGANGTNGTNGTNGAAGPQGSTGAPGAPGVRGLQGLQGGKGRDGVQGPAGENGLSTYFHIAYADDSSGNGFTQNGALQKLYIGTYVDELKPDAAPGSDYWNWQLVKGADGENGENGIPGTNGTNGKTTYLHIAYATNITGTAGFSTTVSTGKTHIGQYTDFKLADSNNAGDYTWSLIKGDKGAQGTKGSQGTKGAQGTKGSQGSTGAQGADPDTSTFLTQSTLINGATITTGILKNGNFQMPGYASGAGAGELTSAPWNTYADAGMGINLDKGAINAKNFYIDQQGNAKFRGDMDIEGNATIGGELASKLFTVDEETSDDSGNVIPRRLKFKSDVYFGNQRFDTFNGDFQTIAASYAGRYDDVTYDRNSGAIISESNDGPPRGLYFTASHTYIKRNDIQIEVGDLVKLDENNELVKASSAKDSAIVGILWQGLDFTIKESPLDKFLPNGKDTSEKPHHYRDSLGNKIPVTDRDIKTIWRVASIGDSREGGLTGMKVCDQNGLILKGDLVCSSDTPGYVMKQPVDYVIVGFENEVPIYEERQTINSFTVGKCMEDCAFDTEGKAEGIYGYLYCG
jgi:hypothetical protein